ncbi:MAG: class I SAM-dependent rRNA methyltransferase [Bacteroidales bacterium]|nr:class I SAM-dependent rRNA methyltransferase [Bacteroidales bacterium]
MARAKLILHKGKEKSVFRRHPWLFSGAVARIDGQPAEGDVVDVISSDGQWLACGHFQSDSILCKLLSFDCHEVDEAFWRQRLHDAVAYRKTLGLLRADGRCLSDETTMFRLINGEGDRLPGLIADYYNGIVVLQAHSLGMHRALPTLAELLPSLLPDLKGVYDKSQATLPPNTTQNTWLIPPDSQQPLSDNGTQDSGHGFDEWEATEWGNQYIINFPEGQKTGFFLDQRDNRRLVGRFAEGKRVLNCFGYTGGFTLSALRGGAAEVDTVDISKRAIDLCDRHVQLNFPQARHRGIVADVTKYLDTIDNQYDIIILDPPAFAKNHRSLQNGLKGYRNINQRAIEKIKAGGLIFTFSCSQAVSTADFQTMAFTAAATAKRNVRIVKQLQHAPDHPVSLYHPEGHYLKGLLLQVE